MVNGLKFKTFVLDECIKQVAFHREIEKAWKGYQFTMKLYGKDQAVTVKGMNISENVVELHYLMPSEDDPSQMLTIVDMIDLQDFVEILIPQIQE